MIAANKIIYNGLSSIDLDLLVDVSFDSDDGETSSFLSREAIASESYKGDFRHIHNYKWNEVFSPKFTFVKKDFSDFNKSELRRLYTWLTSKPTADFITVYYDDSEVISWEALGGFIECSAYKIANNRTVGVVATFESVSPFAFSPLQIITKDVSKEIDTTMYYWTSILVSGTSVPQYLLTQVQTPKIGTKVYSVKSAITETIITVEPTFYGAISKINDDGSYVINNTTFNLIPQSTITKRSLDNKIIINLETDDIPNPVYPRITIKHNSISNIVKVDHIMKDSDHWVDGTVFFYDDVYYWVDKDNVKHISATNDSGIETTSVSITNTCTGDNDDDYEIKVFDTLVKNNIKGEIVTLDGANNIVSSSRANDRIFDKDFSWEWIPLYEGQNTLSFIGNCTVTIEYRYPIKCGEF